MDIKLEHYRVFVSVAQTTSFSKAAAELFMTQSAVSQSIKNLENALGTTLFLRGSKGVQLTAEGHMLYEYADNALSLLENGCKQLERLRKLEAGELRIGVGDTISRYFLLPALERFHQKYPKIRLKIFNRVSRDTAELLKAGKIDLAFVNLPMQDETIESREILTIHDIFVAGDAFSFLKGRALSPGEIAALPLVLLESKSNSRRVVEDSFLKKGVALAPEIELGSHDLLLDFAKSNLGISCVIREFSQGYLKRNELFELTQAEPLPARHIGVCSLRGVSHGAAAEAFLKLLENLCPQEQDLL
ncbi:LysR family transcriptional regulator [Acidaminobacterium chupaoyuni]